MKDFFRKLFGVFPGEGKKTFRFTLLVIFWSFGATCVSTLTDGMFIEKIGADLLPKAYFLSSFIMIGGTSLILYLLRITSPYRILIGVLVFGGVVDFSAAVASFYTIPVWFWFAIKVFSLAFIANLIACSWALIDHYHDLQDAKRTYSLYNTAYFVGNLFSGVLISFFLKKLGPSVLFVVASSFLFIAIWGAKQIKKKNSPVHDETIEGVFSGDRKGIVYLLKKIFSHPFVFTLLSLSLICQLIASTTEFSYLGTFGRVFQGSENKVTEFLAMARAWISFFNILLGVFFYGRFVQRVGLQNAILVPAFFFFFVFSGWVFSDTLLPAILGVIAVDGILYTIEDNNYNLFMNAVPSKLKSKVRIINDSFFEPLGMLFSSLFLLFIHGNARIFGLVLAGLMLVFSFIMRAIYHTSLLSALKENAVHFERKIKYWLTGKNKKEVKEELFKGLFSPNEDVVLLACEALLSLDEAKLLPAILSQVDHLSQKNKIRLLKLLAKSSFADSPHVIKWVDQLRRTQKAEELLSECQLYLAKKGQLHPEEITKDLENSDLLLKAAAIMTLKKNQQPSSANLLNKLLAKQKLEQLLRSKSRTEVKLGLEILAELTGAQRAEIAFSFIENPDPSIRLSASFALAKLSSRAFSRYSKKIINTLYKQSDAVIRLNLLKALKKMTDLGHVKQLLSLSVILRSRERRLVEETIFSMGTKTVPILLANCIDVSEHDRCRILAGKILSRLDLQKLQTHLNEIIQVEIKRAYFYFYHAHTIQEQYPMHDLSMLQISLETGFQSVIDFIIHLLAAADSIKDCELIVRSLRSTNAKIHSHAVETIERTCERSIFKKLVPLIDDVPLETKMEAYVNLMGEKPKKNLPELLYTLDKSYSTFDRIVAAKLKAHLQLPDWKKQIQDQITTSHESFEPFAHELLKL